MVLKFSIIFLLCENLFFVQSSKNETIGISSHHPALNPSLVRRDYEDMNYATIWRIDDRAIELQEEIDMGKSQPFGNLLRLDYVDVRVIGQKAITFVNELVAAVIVPESYLPYFPADVVQRAETFKGELVLHDIGSGGSYLGLKVVRKAVANSIANRDGGIPPNYKNIILTNGVYEGFDVIMKLLQLDCKDGESVGVLVPQPLYTMYSSIMSEHGVKPVFFRLRQDTRWEFEIPEMELALKNSKHNCNCQTRAFLLTNPGMPWGRIQTVEKLQEIIRFAYDHNLLIIADEILLDSIIGSVPFTSTRKVLQAMPSPYNETEVIVLYSVSKGYMGESGLRGGYMDLVNIDPKINGVIAKIKAVSYPNQAGQAALYSYANPPAIGEPSFNRFESEKKAIITTQRVLGRRLTHELNKLKGVKCTDIEGGLVAFANLTLPSKAFAEAKRREITPDDFFALEMLEQTGLAVSTGTAFNMRWDDPFLRVVIPSSELDFARFLKNFKSFHAKFFQMYE